MTTRAPFNRANFAEGLNHVLSQEQVHSRLVTLEGPSIADHATELLHAAGIFRRVADTGNNSVTSEEMGILASFASKLTTTSSTPPSDQYRLFGLCAQLHIVPPEAFIGKGSQRPGPQ